MKETPSVQRGCLQSAGELFVRLGKSQLPRQRKSVDHLLHYFDTGELPKKERLDSEKIPRIIKPRLLEIGDTLYEVTTDKRGRNPIFPFVKQVVVNFMNSEGQEDAPLWKEVTSEEERNGSTQWVFNTTMSLRENLEDFYSEMISPGSEAVYPTDTSDLEEWLRTRHEETGKQKTILPPQEL